MNPRAGEFEVAGQPRHHSHSAVAEPDDVGDQTAGHRRETPRRERLLVGASKTCDAGGVEPQRHTHARREGHPLRDVGRLHDAVAAPQRQPDPGGGAINRGDQRWPFREQLGGHHPRGTVEDREISRALVIRPHDHRDVMLVEGIAGLALEGVGVDVGRPKDLVDARRQDVALGADPASTLVLVGLEHVEGDPLDVLRDDVGDSTHHHEALVLGEIELVDVAEDDAQHLVLPHVVRTYQ